MPLYLGHTTAELLLDALPVEEMEAADAVLLENCVASRSAMSHLDLHLLEDLPKPYDVLVSSSCELRRWSGVRCHRCPTDLPPRSFIEIAPEVFVTSPELCFVLRAQELSLAKTMMLGSRHCGTFALDARQPSGLRRRSPISTPERLITYAEATYRLRGSRRAKIAALHVGVGSASPMESATRLLLSLPRHLGGYAFKSPSLNYTVPLNARARQIAGKSYIVIDAFWPDFDYGLEYQGHFSHTSNEDIANDIARQLAADADGITLQMVTSRQFLDPAQRRYLVQKIAKHINERIPRQKGFQTRNDALAHELFT
jgi:hypothetical protein